MLNCVVATGAAVVIVKEGCVVHGSSSAARKEKGAGETGDMGTARGSGDRD